MTAQVLIDRLDMVRSVGASRWVARCPSHEDRSPSLSVTETDDGRTLIYCHAGCGAADVVSAVGMELSDLFPPRPQGEGARAHKQSRMRCGLTVKEAVALLKRDALIVAIAAARMVSGEASTDEDLNKLNEIAVRTDRVWEVRYGHA